METQFLLKFNTQKGFGGITLLRNMGEAVDEESFQNEASAQIGDGFSKEETLPNGQVVVITVAPKV